jgi:putative addiction module CopG family antidote
MTETFPPDLQQFVQQEVASGRYRDEGELVQEAVRFYRDSNRRHQELKESIKASLEQIDRGEGIRLENDAALEAFFDDIEAEVEEELAKAEKSRQ